MGLCTVAWMRVGGGTVKDKRWYSMKVGDGINEYKVVWYEGGR